VHGTIPTPGAEVIMTLGSRNNLERLFAGFLTDIEQIYPADNTHFIQAICSCVDYAWWLGFRKVTKRYRSAGAGAIIADLLAWYASENGFTANYVDPTLPVVTEITFTNDNLPDAITRVCKLVGAYWYVDYNKNVHAFLSETRNGTPLDLTPTHPTLMSV